MNSPLSSLLENELVKKYFGEGPCLGEPNVFQGNCKHKNCTALRILKAQCEPIKKGEKFLTAGCSMKISECEGDVTVQQVAGLFHPYWLKLPSQHQPHRECPYCHRNDRPLKQCCQDLHKSPSPSPDEVVEKIILEIAHDYVQPIDKVPLACRIRDLLKLARERT